MREPLLGSSCSVLAVGKIRVGTARKGCRMVVRTQMFPYNASSDSPFSCGGNSYAEYINVLSLEQNKILMKLNL